MHHLSDTHRILLAAAARRADGVIALSDRLSGAVLRRTGEKLLGLGLAIERPRRAGEPLWRTDEIAGPLVLAITPEGLAAIGIAEEAVPDAVEPAAERVGEQHLACAATMPRSLRPGTKKASVVALLTRADGVDLAGLVDATGWLPHTASAALTGLRKDGYAIETIRSRGVRARYRLTDTAPQAMPDTSEARDDARA